MNKYLTFSYDDGVTQDIRLIELFNKYNMKATFNLNSGLLGRENHLIREGVCIDHTKVQPQNVRHIYDGHEIAAHTLTHPLLTTLDRNEIIRQTEQDRLVLSDLCGYEVVGMAYPGGSYSDFVSNLIKENTGIQFARTVISTHSFHVQKELFQFHPTVYHHKEMDTLFTLGEEFLNLHADTPQIFFVWGHAYEFDIHDDWAKFEDFLQMMCGREDICYCTNREALLAI